MKATILLAIASAALTLPAAAADSTQDNSGYDLALSWGTFGVLDTEVLMEVDLELRMPAVAYDLRPITGVGLLEDGGNYLYGGLRYEYGLTPDWELSPSFALGLYSPGHVDLGGPLEFRSGLDLNYRVSDNSQFGFGVSHISNGGIYSRNGGSESLVFSYSISL